MENLESQDMITVSRGLSLIKSSIEDSSVHTRKNRPENDQRQGYQLGGCTVVGEGLS